MPNAVSFPGTGYRFSDPRAVGGQASGAGRGPMPEAYYRATNPTDVIDWIDAGKRDGAAVEVLYLAQWAFHTGRSVGWCPFDGQEQTPACTRGLARNRFINTFNACAQRRRVLRHHPVTDCFGVIPGGAPVRDISEPLDLDDEPDDGGLS